jgi:hypothetical protein
VQKPVSDLESFLAGKYAEGEDTLPMEAAAFAAAVLIFLIAIGLAAIT